MGAGSTLPGERENGGEEALAGLENLVVTGQCVYLE
jgi:hypothetical protein